MTRKKESENGCLGALTRILIGVLLAVVTGFFRLLVSIIKWLNHKKITLPVRKGYQVSGLVVMAFMCFLCISGSMVYAWTDTQLRAIGVLPTYTLTPSLTPTATNTPFPTQTLTSIPTATSTSTSTPSPTPTNTPGPSPTPTVTQITPSTNTPRPTQIPVASPTSPPAPTVIPATPANFQPPNGYLAPGVWNCPDSTEGAAYVGSNKSDKFHYLTCRHARKIEPDNRLCFENREVAVNYGYIPCGVCKP